MVLAGSELARLEGTSAEIPLQTSPAAHRKLPLCSVSGFAPSSQRRERQASNVSTANWITQDVRVKDGSACQGGDWAVLSKGRGDRWCTLCTLQCSRRKGSTSHSNQPQNPNIHLAKSALLRRSCVASLPLNTHWLADSYRIVPEGFTCTIETIIKTISMLLALWGCTLAKQCFKLNANVSKLRSMSTGWCLQKITWNISILKCLKVN